MHRQASVSPWSAERMKYLSASARSSGMPSAESSMNAKSYWASISPLSAAIL